MDIKSPGLLNQTIPPPAISTAEDLAQRTLQGGVFTALVESSRALPQSGQSQTVFEVLLKTNESRISTQSTTNFLPGQVLRLEVLPDASIRVLEILANPLTQQPNVIQQGLREALPLQQNIASLLNNLLALRPILQQLPASPIVANAQQSLDQLLSTIPSPQQLRQPGNLQTVAQNSGVFLEAKVRHIVAQILQQPAAQTAAQTSTKPNTPPLGNADARPSALEQIRNDPVSINLLRKLVTNDFKAQLINLARALAPLLPAQSATTAIAQASASANAASTLIAKIVVASNQLTQNQHSFTLPSDLSNRLSLAPTDLNLNQSVGQVASQLNSGAGANASERFDLAMSTVLRQLAATLAKVQGNQLSGLAQSTAPDAPVQQSWQLSIPMFYEHQVRAVDITIERRLEGGGAQEQSEQGVQWEVTLGFDWDDQGVFFATLRVVEHTVSTTFWSEQSQTLQRIKAELNVLDRALKELGLDVKPIECRRGTPPVTQSRLDQQLVDIRT